MFEENVVCLGTREYGRSYVQALNEITRLKQQLKDKDEKISKVVEYIDHQDFMDWNTGVDEGLYRRKDILNILNILETNKED